jgi:hypothetical protein
MKAIKLFLSLSLLFVSAATADVLPLQCKSSDMNIIFACDDWYQIAPNGLDDESFIMSPCVAPNGYAFGGWKMNNMPVVLNVATFLNTMLSNPDIAEPAIIGDIEMEPNWVPLVDIENFSVKEPVLGVMYNPEINKIYYEFPSGGMVVNPICSAESVGDGTATVSVMGEMEVVPTASKAVDLSKPGDYCWIGIETSDGAGVKYISFGSYSDCKSECMEIPLMVPIYRYVEPEIQSVVDMIMSQILTIMLGK